MLLLLAQTLHQHKVETVATAQHQALLALQLLMQAAAVAVLVKKLHLHHQQQVQEQVERAAAAQDLKRLRVQEVTEQQPAQQTEAVAAWRQARDAQVFADDRPSCCGSPTRAALQMPPIVTTPSAGKRPRDADAVLARGLDVLGK